MNKRANSAVSAKQKYFIREEISFIEMFMLWGAPKMNQLAFMTIQANWLYFTMIEEQAKKIRANKSRIVETLGEAEAEFVINDSLDGLIKLFVEKTTEQMDKYFFNYDDSSIRDLSIVDSEKMMKLVWDKKGRENFTWTNFVQMFVEVNFEERITGKPPISD